MAECIAATDPPLISDNDLCNYLVFCISSIDEVGPGVAAELRDRWARIISYVAGRAALRKIPFGDGPGVEEFVCMLPETARRATRHYAPDLFYSIVSPQLPLIDLDLLILIEQKYQSIVCRKTVSGDRLIAASLIEALCIPFYQRANAIHVKWYPGCMAARDAVHWGVPPQERRMPGLWYVTQREFEERLTWVCPFVNELLRESGGVLTGSIIPLCALRHEVYMDGKTDFLAYARENYRNCSFDVLVTEDDMTRFLTILQRVSKTSSWRVQMLEWVEDGEWVRGRRGTTYYVTSPVVDITIQVLYIPAVTRHEAIASHHVPCVRAMYDGATLHCTAECFLSWMTRFVQRPPVFGSRVPAQRRAKIITKYITRGWGFSSDALVGITIPETVVQWLHEWPIQQSPLPWFHPLYNPAMWGKAMSAENVQRLIECAEV